MAQPGMNPDLQAILQQLTAQQATPPVGGGMGGAAPGTPPDMGGAYGAAPADPTMQDPTAMAADPHQQAVWDEFPGTDPQTIAGLLDQQTDPASLLAAVTDLFSQDEQTLADHHHNVLAIIQEHMSQPQGTPDMQGTVPPGPGVGGQGLGL